MNIKCTYLSLQELGKRSNQEDSIYPKLGERIADNDLFILCDGMGGHECGEVASQTVCEAMSSYIKSNPDTDFETALKAAYDALDAVDNSEGKKMGTTMTFLKIEDEACIVAHIGDSRVYQIRPSEKRLIYVTRDHSLVNDLIACGELTPEEAKNSKQKNIITRAMQPNQAKRTKADVAILTDVKDGDYFYMCSDGMLEISEDQDIVNVLSMSISDEEKIEILRGVTIDNADNHTAHLIRITKSDETTNQKDSHTKAGKKPFNKKLLVALVIAAIAIFAGAGYLLHIKDSEGDRPDFNFLKILRDSTKTDMKKDTINDFILNPSDEIAPDDKIESKIIDNIDDTIQTNI